MAEPTITITNKSLLTDKGLKALEEILKAAGLTSATVTSGRRTPAKQASIMYDNAKKHGVAHQKKLYGKSGDAVIDVYEANKTKTRAQVIKLMEAKIKGIGSTKVSAHCSSTKDVFDVAPSSITDKTQFEVAVNAHASVTKFLKPPDDPAYHIVVE